MTRRGQEGLTLLELLVGLVLFGLLMAVISQASGSILEAWRRGQESFAAEPELFAAKRIMRRQLISAVPYHPGSRPSRSAAFLGNPREMTFVSCQSLGSRARMGLWFVRYSLQADASGAMVLVAREWPAADEAWWEQASIPVEPVVLVGGITAASLEYQFHDPVRRQYQFLPDWGVSQAGRLPMAVRLRMARQDGEVVWELPLACGGSRVPRVGR